MVSKGYKSVRSEGNIFGGADERLEATCERLIRQGHLNVWDYGWSFFEAALKYTQEAEKREYELRVKLHGYKLKGG